VLDINQIAYFGRYDGTLSDKIQRDVYSLCDGIIGGQGDGPLSPSPLPLGIIAFTNNPALTDMAMAILMGFDIQKFPLLTEAQKIFPIENATITYNHNKIDLHELNDYAIKTIPPSGWKLILNQR
jgi:uncharacterized protein (DUF362 family)